jgi:molybdopterin molybdotransferase
MISYQEALGQIKKIAENRKISAEILNLEDCVGRILAEDIYVRESQPQFNLSAMDGFAVKVNDVQSATVSSNVELEILSVIAAGDSVSNHNDFNKTNVAVEIMTGAVVPSAFNAVVKIEDTLRKDSILKLAKPLKEFENIRLAGSDFNKGTLLLKKGTKITETHIMGLTAQGIIKMPVVKRARVAIINTGKEIVPFQSQELSPGQIRNSSGPLMRALLKKYSCDLVFYQQIPDEPKLFYQLMQNLLEQKPDLILTTGAVSMGVYDFIKSVLTDLKVDVHFHKVAIRPGKPLLFASGGEITIFSVPGNPISTAVAMRFFVEPYLRMIQQEPAECPLRLPLAKAIKKPEGLTCFYKAKLEEIQETPWIQENRGIEETPELKVSNEVEKMQALKVSQEPQGVCRISAALDQGSAVISSFMQAQYWVSLPAEKNYYEENEVVEVYPLF